ncbi:MAG: MlaD family protein [Treponema sp.]|jgi:phospholipid/cholesterol/gamma-HCH transport system substrate-binding protein|nr:MlaD family protein [Treponema sp.]
MKFSIRFADKIVGALVIIALAVLVSVIFILGKNQRWFSHDSQYWTYFSSASGISPNMAVKYKGITIGHVKKISLGKDDKVEVIFSIFEEYDERVTEGSMVEVQVSPIGLGNSFIFYPGLGTKRLDEGSLVPEINSQEAKQLQSDDLAVRIESNDSINRIMSQASTLLETINVSLAGEGGTDQPSLGQIVANIEGISSDIKRVTQALADELTPLIQNLEEISGKIAGGSMYGSLESSLASISGIAEDLNRTADFIPAQLPQLGVLITELNTALSSIQDVLTAISNNPLLKGGIPARPETGPGGASPRNQNF